MTVYSEDFLDSLPAKSVVAWTKQYTFDKKKVIYCVAIKSGPKQWKMVADKNSSQRIIIVQELSTYDLEILRLGA